MKLQKQYLHKVPEVSVIIPNYNHARFLNQRIDSVLNQTYQDFELIILDDFSIDNSRLILQQYKNHPKVKDIIFNNKNSGSVFKQWQKGIELAEGNLIWIAESDDFSDHSFLHNLVPLFKDNNLGIAFSDSNWIDTGNNINDSLSIYTNSFERTGIEEIKTRLIYQCTIQNVSSVVFKKSFLLQHINKIINYKSCGDWLLYILILQQSNIAFVGKKLNYFRWYHNNISNAAAANDLWLFEHIKLLKAIDLKKISLEKRTLFPLLRNLASKCIRSKKLSFKQKLISLGRIVVLYLT